MSILIFLIILSVLVLVHEFGHFLAAKKRGVAVEEFAIGFPPRLFGIKYKETIYSINLIPIGGYVKLFGEEYYEKNQKSKIKNQKSFNKMFVNKKPWEKALIVIAGIIGNFLLGWVLISYLFTQGVPSPAGYVIVENVQKNSPAYQAQLKAGDKIVKVKYQKNEFIIKSSSDLINLSKKFAGEKIILQIERDNKVFYKEITPRKNPPPGQGALGIVITSFIEKKYPWYLAPFLGLYEAYRITATIVVELSKTIFQLLTFQKPKVDVAGPVGIAAYTVTVVKFGKNAVLELMALLSLNLAVVNLLPFPALDGGRLVFVLYEWFTKKRPKEEIERYTNLIGLIFLLALSVIITYRDIIKLINK